MTLVSTKNMGAGARKKFGTKGDGLFSIPDGACSYCGNSRHTITQRPADPPIGHGNYKDRYEVECVKCKKKVGVHTLEGYNVV